MERILDSNIRWHILKRNAGAVFGMVMLFWGLTLVAYVLGLFGLVFVRRGRELDPNITAIMSLVLTVLGCLYSGRWYLKASLLSRRGIQVKGTVRNIGGIKDLRPWRRLTFSFMHDERAYNKSLWGGGVSLYEVGSPVQIIIDPQKPKRCLLREDVFPPGYDLEQDPFSPKGS